MQPHYRRRVIDDLLDEIHPHLPAIALEGPKGVGKTLTAAQRASTIFQCEEDSTRQLLSTDPSVILRAEGTVLIDEWQRHEPIWDFVRRSVDNGAPDGKFLLTGSAYPPDGTAIHSGAGRIDSLRMRPFGMQERSTAEPLLRLRDIFQDPTTGLTATEISLSTAVLVEELTKSGLPGIMDRPEAVRSIRLDSYLERIATHEFVQLGMKVREPHMLMSWLRAYAQASSTMASYSEILDAATPGDSDKPSKNVTLAYRGLLEQLMIMEPLPAWQPIGTTLPTLAKAPKHHLCDPGLAAALLGAGVDELLGPDPRSTELLGQLLESFTLLTVRVAADAMLAKTFHMRTRRGDHEVDIIVEDRRGRIIAIEVKLSPVVRDDDLKHLHWLRKHMGERFLAGIVVHAGQVAYQREDGIFVLPLAALS